MISLQVKVKPGSRDAGLYPPPDPEGHWQARLKSPPVDGKANAELIALVAAYFGCPKSRVSLKSGAAGKLKRVLVDIKRQ